MDLDSPEVEALLNSEQEEQPPFPGARRILNWEQRIVGAPTACLPATAATLLLRHLAFLHMLCASSNLSSCFTWSTPSLQGGDHLPAATMHLCPGFLSW